MRVPLASHLMETLPQWCAALPDAEQMREVDRWAIERRGVPSLALMERAGEAVARAVEGLCPDGPVAVVCGKGNNGGDGLVVARLLRERGRRVDVLLACDPASLSGDAAESLRRLPGDAPLALIDPRSGALGEDASRAISSATAIVDALLGTGFHGRVQGAVAVAVEAILAARAPVIAVDVPSGVDASTGEVDELAVSAEETVTFHAAKPGLWIHPGKQRSGEVIVADIGIPRGAPARAQAGLVGPEVLRLLPRRGADSTKFTSGHVLVVGGSTGLTGAPRMAAEAAMRAGAGYVTACVPASLQPLLVGAGRAEMMTRALPDADGALRSDAMEVVLAAAQRGGALVLGPGIGRAECAAQLARDLAREAPLPLVLDADGLNAHEGRLQELASRRHATVITPHAAELGRLLGIDSHQVQRQRMRRAREAARLSGATVVLKGDDTLVADPSGALAVSPGGSPALATAGTGDVLSGVIAALLAGGLGAFDAAAAGVYMHLLAGGIAAQRQGSAEGVIAGDVIAALPSARAQGAERAAR